MSTSKKSWRNASTSGITWVPVFFRRVPSFTYLLSRMKSGDYGGCAISLFRRRIFHKRSVGSGIVIHDGKDDFHATVESLIVSEICASLNSSLTCWIFSSSELKIILSDPSLRRHVSRSPTLISFALSLNTRFKFLTSLRASGC